VGDNHFIGIDQRKTARFKVAFLGKAEQVPEEFFIAFKNLLKFLKRYII
jgi:hypothetical protein